MATLARGQITIVDLNDARQVHAYLNPSVGGQVYNSETKVYTPDFAATGNNLIVTPRAYVTGSSTNIVSQMKNIKYTINGTELSAQQSTEASASGKGYKVSSISSGAVLTITANIPSTASCYTIHFSGTYNSASDTAGQDLAVEADCSVMLSPSAGALFTAQIECNNNVFDATTAAGSQVLTAVCKAYHGGTQDTTLNSAVWQKFVNGTWTACSSTSTDSVPYYTTASGVSTLYVHPDDVLNFQSFRCVITDSENTSLTATSDIITFEDKTDPYTIDLVCPTGDKIINGTGSTVVKARVWRGTTLVENEDTEDTARKFTYTWTKYNADGETDNWYTDSTTKGTSSTKTGNPITVYAADVDSKVTIFCEITKKQ